MRPIHLHARPDAIELDLARTALIIVDMQNDFGSEGGMFHRAGIDIAPIQDIVPRIKEVVTAVRAARMPIVYLKQQHEPDLSDAGNITAPHFIKHRRMQLGKTIPTPDGGIGRILVKDTWNTAIVTELTPMPEDIIIGKHRFSGFFETELHERLQALNTKYLVFVGATTSICVESTLRDAMFRDYVCVVLEDCTAEPIAFGAPRSNHEASLLNIELLFGWVTNASSLLASLGSRALAAE